MPILEALYGGLEPAEGDKAPPVAGAQQRRDWLQSVLRRGFNFVAEQEGALVAHLVLIRVGDSAEMTIFVPPDYRRRGIGTALLRIAVDQARDMGLRHVWVAVRPEDTPIREGLVRFGFTVSRQTEDGVELLLAL